MVSRGGGRSAQCMMGVSLILRPGREIIDLQSIDPFGKLINPMWMNLWCILREQDEYGFKIIPDYELDDMKLLAKIQALEIRSHNLLHQVWTVLCPPVLWSPTLLKFIDHFIDSTDMSAAGGCQVTWPINKQFIS